MGSDPAAAHAPDPDESPRHRVACPAFRIGRTPVTNREYLVFVETTEHDPPSSWPRRAIPPGRELHPVTYVSWDDARAFCSWAGGALPTEAQWERAARGDDGRTWPWGDEPPSAQHACFGMRDTAPVGGCPLGAGPFGAVDLAGNAWEWTASLLRPYPYDPSDGREDESLPGQRVVRGGSYIHGAGEVRCAYRHGMLPDVRDHYVGFRVACAEGGSLRAGIDLVEVPAGLVAMGNDSRPSAGPGPADEVPQHPVVSAGFELSVTPVTNAQYHQFARATRHPVPAHWTASGPPPGLAQHPVTYVDWHDAAAFCAWSGARLPTEAEWEKGARGSDGRLYPWGADEPDERRATFGRGSKHGSTTPVAACGEGASPYGLLDMAGNVWEWVASAYRPYPYRPDDGREDVSSPEPRVLRGGSYASPSASHLRCAARSRSYPGRRAAHIGFRVARAAG